MDCEEYSRWMKQALHTLKLVKADIEYEGYGWACFKAQQAAEYALKAILRGFGRPAFGHSVLRLYREFSSVCGEDNELERCAALLDKMYIPPRYPDAFAEGAPYEYYTRYEAEEVYECASRLISVVIECGRRAGCSFEGEEGEEGEGSRGSQ